MRQLRPFGMKTAALPVRTRARALLAMNQTSSPTRCRRKNRRNRWPSIELRYQLPQASEVILAWGIDGWQPLPEDQLPAGTIIDNGVMKSPMIRDKDEFVVRVKAPPGAALQYGFLTPSRRGLLSLVRPIWDDAYEKLLVKEDVRLTLSPDPDLLRPLASILPSNWPALALSAAALFVAVWIGLFLVVPARIGALMSALTILQTPRAAA